MEDNFTEILRDYVQNKDRRIPLSMKQPFQKKWTFPRQHSTDWSMGHSKPRSKTLSKLLQFIPELKNSLPKEISQILQVTLEREKREYIEKTLDTLLSNKYLFLCWTLSFSEKGTTEEEVIKSFGQQGRIALETF